MNDPRSWVPAREPGGATWGRTLTRREILLGLGAAGVAALSTACSRGATHLQTLTLGSIDALRRGTTGISMLAPTTPVNPGRQTFAFFLATQGGVIAEAAPRLWSAKDESAKATGPVGATWYPLTGYQLTHDRSPRSPLAV